MANLIGGCIFFWVDKWIFGDKKAKKPAMEGVEELMPEAVTAVVDDKEDLD